jgi:hypothetical protein
MSKDYSDKTSFMRWLDLNPPTHDPRYNKIRSRNRRWGSYSRREYPEQFNQLYEDYWLKHPEVWKDAYPDELNTGSTTEVNG